MKSLAKTKKDLIDDVESLKRRIAELEAKEAEREAAEEALIRSRRRYEDLVNSVDGIVWEGEADSLTFTFVSKRAERILGYPIEEWLKDGFWPQRLHPDDREWAVEFCKKATELGKDHDFEYRMIAADGRVVWFREHVAVSAEEGKRSKILRGVMIDITVRKSAEEALRKTEERFRTVISNAPIILFSIDRNGIVTLSEGRGLTALDLKPNDLMGKSVYELYADVPKVLENVRRALSGEAFIDVVEVEDVTFETHYMPLFQANEEAAGMIGVATNITDRKRAETALRISEEQYRLLFESNPHPMWVTDHETFEFIAVNEAAVRHYGYSREEFLSMTLIDIRPPEDVPLFYDRIGKLDPERDYAGVWRHRKKDGSVIDVEITYRLIAFGGRSARLTLAHDITERKRSEEKLLRSETRYRLARRATNDAIWDWDLATNQIEWGEGIQLFGYSQEEAGDVNWWNERIHPEDRERTAASLYKTINDGEKKWIGEYRFLRADGSYAILIDCGYVLHDENGKPVRMIGAMSDVTEKRKIEEEMMKGTKLESVGLLAGGIAHDFNNILTAILGNISLAKDSAESRDQLYQRLSEIEKASLLAKGLTQQLLTFAKGGAPIVRTASIKELLKESVLFALIGSNIQCDFCIPDDLLPVEIDEGQMNQVINNLVINAQQAMPEGGKIEVFAENIESDSKEALPLQARRYVRIAIRDQGVGIPKDDFGKIFDPYFTTKAGGTGLGLATSYSIIKKHNGYISVESEVGVGTTFYIYLPVSDKTVPSEASDRKEMQARKAKVLIMDDRDIIREVMREMLSRLGYDVAEAKDGAEAIDLYKSAMDSGRPFDVVILDLTIPGGMGGKEAVKKLLDIDPKAKAIVSSGYSNDPIMADYKKHGFVGVAAKPYKVNQLKEVLISVLNGSE